MLRFLLTIAIASFALLLAAPCVQAQDGAPLARRLNAALKLYPDADANKDGALTIEEALQYIAAHPELKTLLAKTAADDSEKRVSTKPAAPFKPAEPGQAEGPRLFVCAHSFMIFTAQMLPPMAQAAGIAHRAAGQQMIGGSRVIQHWSVPDERNAVKKALLAGGVDVLTLSPHMLLPDEGIDNFTKLGLEENPKLRVLVQASWPARDGNFDKSFSNEQRNQLTSDGLSAMRTKFRESWLKLLETQVSSLNARIGHPSVHIIPVGSAVFALREQILAGTAPGLTQQTDLFRDDLGHPKPPLAVLVTYCHFAAIFGKSPVGLPVPKELQGYPQADQLNTLLQQIAWNTVTSYPLSEVHATSVH